MYKLPGLAALLLLSTASAQGFPRVATFLMRPTQIFAPPALAETDQARFVFEAWLPSTCHMPGTPRVWIDIPKNEIILEATAYWHSGPDCERVTTRQLQVVELGTLPTGHYRVLARLSKGNLLELGEVRVGCKD